MSQNTTNSGGTISPFCCDDPYCCDPLTPYVKCRACGKSCEGCTLWEPPTV